MQIRVIRESEWGMAAPMFQALHNEHVLREPDRYADKQIEVSATKYGKGTIRIGAFDHGKLAGIIFGFSYTNPDRATPHMAEIEDIYVSPGYRHQGVGTQLMEEFKRRCQEGGVECLRLGVVTTNTVAQDFYKKLGYGVKEYKMELMV